jgi:hypothetical protein
VPRLSSGAVMSDVHQVSPTRVAAPDTFQVDNSCRRNLAPLQSSHRSR